MAKEGLSQADYDLAYLRLATAPSEYAVIAEMEVARQIGAPYSNVSRADLPALRASAATAMADAGVTKPEE